MTVVIPTAGRPETLEATLVAVARQTAVPEIERIIVSENLGDLRSKAACDRFPELGIEYVVQEPQLTPHAHAAWLLGQARTEFLAFVCDDDLWSPGHVAAGLDALRRQPEAGAFFSAFIGAESELAMSGSFWGAGLLWLAAGRPERPAQYRYDYAQVLALSWVFTPFQYSTLVARSTFAAAAAPTLARSTHQFYADRVLCVALAEQAPIIFEPVADTLYRVYSGNWQNTQTREHLKELLRTCDEEVEARAEAAHVDLPSAWRGYLENVPDEIAPEVRQWLSDRFSAQEMRRYCFSELMPVLPARPLASRVAGRLTRAFRALSGR